jgi:PAS domain S-box-containing protein
MTNKADKKFSELRGRALEILSRYQHTDAALFHGNIRELILELDTNRVELELQNEELRNAHVELENARQKYNELYKFAPVGYVTLSSDGCIIESNLRAAHMLNVSRKELYGRKFSTYVHFDDQDIFHLHIQNLKEFWKRQSCSLRLKRGGGSHLHVLLESVLGVEKKGLPGQVLTNITDISDLIQARQEVTSVNEELEQRVQQRTLKLEQAQSQLLHSEKLAAIGTLAASIAHELNNPLQGVLNVIKGVGRRAVLEPEDTELMEIAVNECMRMRDLLKALQDFNRPSSGIRAPIDIHSALDSVLLLYKKMFSTNNITIDKQYGDNIPIFYAVADQIKQVIMNILSNAVDACSGGGLITIKTESNDSYIALSIIDNGVGIDPANKYNIFEPFFSTKPDVKGTGLGLSVSYGIIKKHNGVIEVNSMPDKGTVFRIKLPIREPKRV